LVEKGDRVFSDAKNHASIIDGCRLSGAHVHIYQHADAAHLETLLQQSPPARRTLIVTDGLFSMDGDLAPLPALVELAGRHQAMLMVDEAHATGVFGAQGRGVCEHFQLEAQVPIRVGTLSKALGSLGGFVVGSQRLVQWLSNRARTYVFSTAAPEALVAAGHRALELALAEPQRRTAVLTASAALRERLRQQGWTIPSAAISQIIPVILGDPQRTMQCVSRLQEQGLFVPGIRPPSVPAGQSLLRISVSAAHTPAMIEELVDAFGAMGAG
jgi:8-amino-7-oxononanoate synthase